MTQEELNELERKYQVKAMREVEAREQAGLPITEEWLDQLERKYIALALQEIARRSN